MNTRTASTGSREQQLDEIIAEYLRRKHAGESPARESLIAAYVEFADELNEFFDNEARFARVMEPLVKKVLPDAPALTMGVAPVQLPSTAVLEVAAPAVDDSRYQLQSFHARGGMGEVWLAQDQRIGREVAVKVLRHERENQRERFRIEAQINGQLEHPGIVRLYDLDVDRDGQPLYVMQFVRGCTLKDAINDFHRKRQQKSSSAAQHSDTSGAELEFHRLLEVMLDLCQTVAYAHSRGVLHRDLKPDNVMLGAFGETLVLDWGLAKVKDHPEDVAGVDYVRPSGSGEGSSATQAGSVLGSPPYISPEAASGRIQDVDEQSDVFLLGATLYEILTARPPRQGSSQNEIVDMARMVNPPDPRAVNKAVPRPLEAICLKAMARRKQDRYATAMEMATDLRKFLAGEPVSVYREGPLERIARWAKRHRRAIGYAAVALMVLGTASFGVAKWYEVQQLRAYDRGAQQLAEFRRLAGKVHYLAAAVDPLSEELPYYQIGAGQRVARQALQVSDRWGLDLTRLALGPDPTRTLQEKERLKQEIYELTMLKVQSRINESPTKEAATESLALLDRARLQTSSLFRLQSECFRRLGEVEKSEQALRRSLDPRTPRTALDHFLQGELHRRSTWNIRQDLSDDARHAAHRQLLEQAVAEFEIAIDQNPSHYWARLQNGRCLMALERYPEAIQAFSGCIALRADQPWAYASRSLAYALAGDKDRAVEDLNRQIDQSHEFQSVLYLNRGFVHLLCQSDDQALTDFNRIMEADEEQRLSGAAYYRSQIRERRGDAMGALADLNWLLNTDPAFARAYIDRARLLFALNRTSAAMRDLDAYLLLTTIEFDATSWLAHYGRGQLLLDIQATVQFGTPTLRATLESQALQQFQQAVGLGGNVAGLFHELGRLLYLSGDPEAALLVYQQGLQLSPQSASLHLSRGWLLAEANPEAAAEAFQAALQLEPQNSEALAALGYVHARAEKSEAHNTAERLALEALLLGSQDYSELFNIACIHGELGESDPQNKEQHQQNALAVLQRAMKLWNDDGSPVGKSIPKLIVREQASAFRSLRFHPEFGSLLADPPDNH